jgi:hypothetical protein
MAVKKVYKPNIKANAEATKLKRLFMDIKEGTTEQVRPFPIINESGLLFTRAENHFKLKDENGKGLALACLCVHGDEESGEECFLCKLARVLMKYGDKAEKAIGKSLLASARWYVQVARAEDTGKVDEKDEPIMKYTGPYLLGVPKTGADGMNRVLNNMLKARKPDFTNPDKGQDLFVTRHSASPWYSVDRSGVEQNITEIFPDWETKIIEDVYGELGLKIVTPEEQKAAAMRTFGDQLDWEALAEQFDL